MKRVENADSDDAFVYTWSIPEDKDKVKRVENADSDDAFVYTWSIPEVKE